MANPRWASTSSGNFGTNGNWDTGTAPVDGDFVYLKLNSVGIFAGLNQSSIEPTLLQIDATYTGRIGGTDASTNTLGANYLQIGPVRCVIGEPSTSGTTAQGSQRIKLDYGSDTVETIVRSTAGASGDQGLAPVRLKGGSVTSTLYVQAGKVDIATEDPDETANLASFSVTGGVNAGANDSILNLGAGVVWVTGYQTAGTVTMNSKGATYTQTAGLATIKGSDLIGTITIGGTMYFNSRFPVMAVSGITRSSTTATATVSSTATLATGDTVYITGAVEAGYNGFKTITVAGGTTFTFTCASDDVTPATGTITCYKAITSLTVTGNADFSADSRPIHVKTFTHVKGGSYKVNGANPGHLVIGTYTLSNASKLVAS